MTEADKRFIFENDKFFVDVELESELSGRIKRDGCVYTDYYVVVNKEFGIVEFKTPSLVEAISGAAMAQATLNGEPWKFYEKKFEDKEDRIPGEFTLSDTIQ